MQQMLLLYDDNRVIDCAAFACNLPLLRTMFNHLEAGNRIKILKDTFTKLEVIQGMENKNDAEFRMKLFLGVDVHGVANNLPDGFFLLVNFYIGKIYTSELTGFVDFILDVKGIDDDGERTRPYSI